jgi:predicted dinucleotide-binding enzyme
MGRAFATQLAAAGHDVTITATDTAHAEEAAVKAGANARAVRPDAIARDTDLLILAVTYATAGDALRGPGDLTGKTIVDITLIIIVLVVLLLGGGGFYFRRR